MRFSILAARADGSVVRSERHGTDEFEVARALQGDGLLPMEVAPARSPRFAGLRSGALVRINRSEDLFGPLATLLDAGTSLVVALEQLARMDGTARHVAKRLSEWASAIRQGQSLADAMASPGTHADAGSPALALAVVRAGEHGGDLAGALKRLAAYQTEAAEFRRSLVSAMFYPVVLALTALGTLLVIAQFVVPRFAMLFADTGVELPWVTQVIFSAGVWFETWGLVLPAALAVAWLGLRVGAATPTGRATLATITLRAPWLGALVCGRDVVTFCRTLAMALRSGTPLPDGVALASTACDNAAMASGAQRAVSEVRGGKPLSDALVACERFPALATDLVRLGESSGQLASVLDDIATLHEDAVRTALKRALIVLEPIMIIGLGIVVGVVVLALLSAILDLNDLGQVALGKS